MVNVYWINIAVLLIFRVFIGALLNFSIFRLIQYINGVHFGFNFYGIKFVLLGLRTIVRLGSSRLWVHAATELPSECTCSKGTIFLRHITSHCTCHKHNKAVYATDIEDSEPRKDHRSVIQTLPCTRFSVCAEGPIYTQKAPNHSKNLHYTTHFSSD